MMRSLAPLIHRSQVLARFAGPVRCALLLALVAVCSLAAVHPAAAAASHPLIPNPLPGVSLYVHYANGRNSFEDYTTISDGTNGNPNALVVVTPSWDPGGTYPGAFDAHTLGVFYNPIVKQWAIFNQDGSSMPSGAAFNVYDFSGPFTDFSPYAHSGALLQTATATNSAGDWTEISNVVTDNQPNELLTVTPNWSINDVYDNHPLGVWYSNGHWYIFHEDQTAIPVGAAYNVVAFSPGYATPSYVQQATQANSTSDYTQIDNFYLNTYPGSIIFVTQEWQGVYNPVAVGVYYNTATQRWTIFNENFGAVPTGALFTVIGVGGRP
jgi:hypothetical protein